MVDKPKVLVCGGRKYAIDTSGNIDKEVEKKTFGVLDYIIQHHFPDQEVEIISGMAKGADTIAVNYAIEKGLTVDAFPADWKTHGKSAGAIRNRQMLMEGRPDLVIALEGGAGTRHMKEISLKMGVPVLEVERVEKG